MVRWILGWLALGLMVLLPTGCFEIGGDDGGSSEDLSGSTLVGNVSSPSGDDSTVSVAGKSTGTSDDGVFAISGISAGQQQVAFATPAGSGSVSVNMPENGTVYLHDVKVSGSRVTVGKIETHGTVPEIPVPPASSGGGSSDTSSSDTSGGSSGGTDPGGSGARLWNVRAAGFYIIRFDRSGTDDWPRWTLSNGKVVNANLYINGNFVDKLAPSATTKGVENTKRGSKYYQSIKTGQTVMVQLRSKDGSQRTNESPFVWPWPGTDEVSF